MQVGRQVPAHRRSGGTLVGRPRIIAHRGASAIAPENTLLAFRLAAEAGADMLETDVQFSRDGAAVLIHDSDLARTTDCIGLVSAMAWSELSVCDAGYWFTPNGATRHPYRGLKIGVPRLEELFALIDALNPAIVLQLELKVDAGVPAARCGRDAARLAQMLAEHGWLNRAIVSSFSTAALDAVKAAEPQARTAYIVGRDADIHAALAYAVARKHEALNPEHLRLGMVEEGRDIVSLAHAAGVAVYPWTVNVADRALELAQMGVDGIMTDDPERLRRVLEAG